ncbi:MAG TPA: hypothetical protein VED85_07545 [Burkholderiaceae bacterium]|nr:hypothetical protein [Burkholderiaceae bacterium]
MKLRLNDNVQWTQQAAGHALTRSGVVVAVIAAGRQPDRVLFRPLFRGSATLPTRDHESYVVLVGDRTLYWPRARLLRSNRSKSELEWARAERRWAATCIEQGWSSETQTTLLEDFIRERGLMPELAAFAANRARFERDVAQMERAVA